MKSRISPPILLALVIATNFALGASLKAAAGAAPRVSGALAAHYAPMTPLQIVPVERLDGVLREIDRAGKTVALMSRHRPAALPLKIWIPAGLDPRAVSHDLYAQLRQLDRAGADLILVEAFPEGEAWLAVADRLGRAAVGAGR